MEMPQALRVVWRFSSLPKTGRRAASSYRTEGATLTHTLI
jgi:hypothetical protein